MRRWVAVLLLVSLVAPSAGAHTVGSPLYVNLLLQTITTPDLAPGEQGPFRVNVTNPYPWQMNATLRFEVYRYVEIDVSRAVNASTWSGPGPDFFDAAGMNHGSWIEPLVPDLASGESVEVAFSVVTYPDTPHGSLTKQGSYFVRTLLDFELWDGVVTNRSLMMSKGYFSDDEFERSLLAQGASCPVGHYCEGVSDLTVLANTSAVQSREPGRDHLDGLLPDMSFSVKDRMPLWPFVVTGGVMVASLVFAVLFYAEENPGKMPRVAEAWMAIKGKARGARRPKPPEDRRESR